MIKISVLKQNKDITINEYERKRYKLVKTYVYDDMATLFFEEPEPITDEEVMIRASREAGTTKDILMDVFWNSGISGVYNLGLKNMMDYFKLKGNEGYDD